MVLSWPLSCLIFMESNRDACFYIFLFSMYLTLFKIKQRSKKCTLPKGATSCWRAAILSPNFSFLT